MSTPVSTYAEWRERVESELAGASFERLRSETADGLPLEPLAIDRDADVAIGVPGAAPFVRGARGERGWWIAQRIETDDPAAANRAALQDLTGGANALRLVLPPAETAPRVWLAGALEGVHLEAIGLILEASHDPRPWLAALDSTARDRGLDLGELQGVLHWPQHLAPTVGPEMLGRSGLLRTAGVDVRALHAAGATPADQLGAAVAGLAELLRGAEAHGVAADVAAGRIAIALSVGAEVFEGIATLRAGRLLWSLVLRAAGVEPAGQPAPFLDVSTSPRSLARIDPWANVLRGTTEAFAAICGGADAVEVWPLDARLDSQTELGRRLARNTQVVLAEEGGLGRVLDPAGGSYAIEALTLARARRAWAVAQEIEALGGYREVSASGWLAARAEASWRRDRTAVRRRRRAITGVSEYATLENRKIPGVPAMVAARVPETTRPLAADFEALRAAAAEGAPRVFLALLGTPAEHGPRLTFLVNLLAAGGIGAVVAEVAADLDPAAAAARLAEQYRAAEIGPTVVCGSDAAYAAQGAQVVAALCRAGAPWVAVAGRPAELEAPLRAAGATALVALGDDVVDFLAEVLRCAGVAMGDVL